LPSKVVNRYSSEGLTGCIQFFTVSLEKASFSPPHFANTLYFRILYRSPDGKEVLSPGFALNSHKRKTTAIELNNEHYRIACSKILWRIKNPDSVGFEEIRNNC